MADADVEIGWWRSVNAHAATTWFDRASRPIISRSLALEYELCDNWQSKFVNICANLDPIIIAMKMSQSMNLQHVETLAHTIIDILFPNIL